MKPALLDSFLITFVLFLTGQTESRSSEQGQKCQEPADIIFVLDSSSSIAWQDFDTSVKGFVKDVIQHFSIGLGPKDTRVGAVVFSTNVHLEFHLNQYSTSAEVMNAVERITFRGGATRTYRALKFVAKKMLTPEHGARKGVAKLVIVLTDGRSDSTPRTLQAADALKTKGAIFAIAIGKRISYEELLKMASSPSSHFAFPVSNFRALQSIKDTFRQSTCEALLTTTPWRKKAAKTTTPITTTTTTTAAPAIATKASLTTKTPPIKASIKRKAWRATPSSQTPQGHIMPLDQACRDRPADIYFLLDVSTSVSAAHFQNRVLQFVRALVSEFHISPRHTRVGLVTFSDKVNHEFGLSEYTNLRELLDAIQPDEIDYLTGGTNTGDAIRYVTNKGFNGNDTRPGVTRIMITVTDGLSQRHINTAQAAAEAKYKGLLMFAVGVGADVNSKELTRISSDPKTDFMFHAESFETLASYTETLAQKICSVIALWTRKQVKVSSECGEKPSNVMFVYDSYKPAAAVQAVLGDLVSTFSTDASIVASDTQIGITTQPCLKSTPFYTAADLNFGLKRELARLEGAAIFKLVRKLRLEVFPDLAARRDRQNIVVLVLDENATRLKELVEEVRMLRANNIDIIVVAVGNVPEPVIQSLASLPVEDHVIRAAGYENLKDDSTNLLNKVCDPGLPVTEYARSRVVTDSGRSTASAKATKKPHSILPFAFKTKIRYSPPTNYNYFLKHP